MKLNITYDLPDKVKEAETGFSLKRTLTKTAKLSTMSTAIYYSINLLTDGEPLSYLTTPLLFLTIHGGNRLLEQKILGPIYKSNAQCEIKDLTNKLTANNVPIRYDNLIRCYSSNTQYQIHPTTGKLEERKYINVPVDDEWGKREIFLCQEHLIGSNEWVLSLGTPKKEKIYSLGTLRAFNR